MKIITRCKFLIISVMLVCMTGFVKAQDEDVRQAIQGALQEAAASLKNSRIPANIPISCLPLGNDIGGYVEGQLKISVVAAGRQYVEGKDDPFWDSVLSEVAWDTRKADMLDPVTLAAFGKLKATKILIYGVVRAAEKSGRRVYAEIELHASAVDTKEHLWGGNFAKRYYLPGPENVAGLSFIPPEVRDPIKAQLSTKAFDSLENAKAKLNAIKTVAYVPLAGDIDKYATFMLRDAISRSHMNPKGLDLNTMGEARLLLRDQPTQADALLYGAVRDISQRIDSRTFNTTTWLVTAEVQACIEHATTNEILWSDTVSVSEHYTKKLTAWETWSMVIFPYLTAHPMAWILPLAILIALIVIFRMISAASRVR